MSEKPPGLDYVKSKVDEFLNSEMQREKKIALDYYHGKHDIRKKMNTTWNPENQTNEIDKDLPNNIVIENLYAKFVDQKVNYAFGKQFKIILSEENGEYREILERYFTNEFYFIVKKLAKDAINCAFGWLVPYIDQDGEFRLKRLSPVGVFPTWLDEEHTEVEELIRAFIEPSLTQQDAIPTTVEVYRTNHMYRFEYYKEQIQPRLDFENHYIDFGEIVGDWDEIPAIPFKANDDEVPLIRCAKGAQDALNALLSNSSDDVQKGLNSHILALEGYDPKVDKNKARLKIMKKLGIAMVPEGGKVSLLQPKIETSAYEMAIKTLRRTVASSCNAVDLETLQNLNNHINETGIKSAYMALDSDTDAIYTNFKWSLKKVVKFLNKYLVMKNEFKPEFEKIKVDFEFVKNQLINETELINNLRNLVGVISHETILENLPYISDVPKELERLKKEKEKETQLGGMFESNVYNSEEPKEEVKT